MLVRELVERLQVTPEDDEVRIVGPDRIPFEGLRLEVGHKATERFVTRATIAL